MKIILLILFAQYLCKAYSQSLSGCGDELWIPYKDQKCFKLMSTESLESRETADQICSRERQDISETYLPTLVEILDSEEQELIENYLFANFTLYDSVWIRAKRGDDNKFYWTPNRPVKYANWETNAPSDSNEKGCVVLTSGRNRIKNTIEDFDIIPGAGLWRDINCNSKALVVCQKFQTWSVPKIQTTLMEIRTNLEYEIRTAISNHQSQIADQQNQINNLIPIGFIYSQLPSQPEPQSIWPNFGWSDISEQFAGQFFRVFGGNSLGFGEIQEENCPRLARVSTYNCGGSYTHDGEIVPNDQWTGNVWSGSAYNYDTAHFYAMNFLVTSGEVRPRNQAIRIWKRIN